MDIEGSWNQRNGLKYNILIEKVKKVVAAKEQHMWGSRDMITDLKTDFGKLRLAGYNSLPNLIAT